MCGFVAICCAWDWLGGWMPDDAHGGGFAGSGAFGGGGRSRGGRPDSGDGSSGGSRLGARYNAEGPEGLRNRPRGGSVCFLDEKQLSVARGWVEAGPDPERHKVVRWRVRNIRRKIEEAFGVAMRTRAFAICFGGRGLASFRVARSTRAATPGRGRRSGRSFGCG